MAIRKIYKKLSDEDVSAGVIFSSSLSTMKEEMEDATIHKVYYSDDPKQKTENDKIIERLKDDIFFTHSHFKYNIIRT